MKADDQQSCLGAIGWSRTGRRSGQRSCSQADVLRFPSRSVRGPDAHSAYARAAWPYRRRWSPYAARVPIACYSFFSLSRLHCATDMCESQLRETKLTPIPVKSALLLNTHVRLWRHSSWSNRLQLNLKRKMKLWRRTVGRREKVCRNEEGAKFLLFERTQNNWGREEGRG